MQHVNAVLAFYDIALAWQPVIFLQDVNDDGHNPKTDFGVTKLKAFLRNLIQQRTLIKQNYEMVRDGVAQNYKLQLRR